MKTYIALFRGINVGGKGMLPMPELVALFKNAGVEKTKTYINSGNVVFICEENRRERLGKEIGAKIKSKFGFEPAIQILDMNDLEKAISENPFPESESDPGFLHLGFLEEKPKNPDLKKLERLKKNSERFQLKGKVFYLSAPEGVGRSKLAAVSEKLLGVSMTDRNWRTACKLMELARALNG